MGRAIIWLFALAIWLSVPFAAAAQGFGAFARVLAEDSRVVAAGGGVDVEIALTQAVPFRVFTLDNPARLVVDFREVFWDDLANRRLPPPIAGMQTGAAPGSGWSRMVMTLSEPLLPQVAAMRTDPVTGGASVTLRLRPVAAEDFVAAAGAPPGVEAGLRADLAVPAPQARDTDRFIVVLDPGHGGVDPGAVRGNRTEAELVLAFARELRDALRRTGRVEVLLTRDADIFVPLPTRVTIARAAEADLFLSIHADALAEGRAEGATIYTLSDTASDAASAALAEQHDRADLIAGVDLAGTDDEIAGVLMDLARVQTAPRSRAFADTLVSHLGAAALQLHPRPRGEAGFSVLKAADIPSVLLEIGYLSDEGDLQNILDPAWRARMQAAITSAVLAWADADAAQRSLLRQ